MIQYNKGYRQDVDIDCILPALNAATPKQALQHLAKKAADILDVDKNAIYAALLQKEEQESAAIGEGVAMPHAKLKSMSRPITIMARLSTPISFENAPDNQAVDVMCLVLSPERDGPLHLRRLSRISRLLKNKELHSKIKETSDGQTIRSLLLDPEGWTLAA